MARHRLLDACPLSRLPHDTPNLRRIKMPAAAAAKDRSIVVIASPEAFALLRSMAGDGMPSYQSRLAAVALDRLATSRPAD